MERSNGTYSALKQMIVSNELSPGQRLLDRELADKLGVSRTPVRDALRRLEQDGLITTRTGRRWFVADLDTKQAADLYELREVLEVHAVHLAAERGTPADFEELERVLTTLETYREVPDKRGEEIRFGLRVHEVIARASGNAVLQETLIRLLDRMLPFIWVEMLYEDSEATETTRREHAMLLTLIREKRVDKAEEVIRTHIQTARDHMLRILSARERFYEQRTGSIGPFLAPLQTGRQK
jgi:DNA-binding GntR family transcriptional regulator